MSFRWFLACFLLCAALSLANQAGIASLLANETTPVATQSTNNAPAEQTSAPQADPASTPGALADAREEEESLAAGHSMHGEAFNEGPRQQAYLMPGMPAVYFAITTKSEAAQDFFNQGVAQLHGFWYFEAERSFRQVAALDPDCAMAYWGMAMANVNNAERAKKLCEEAGKRKSNASSREVAWIDALAESYAGEDTQERRQRYVRDLEQIIQDDPADVEAKALLAMQLWKNSSDMTDKKLRIPLASYQAVDALLDQVFNDNPMHPAHHYRIHLWDNEKPMRALASSAVCGQSSPGIAHMWHMPGHIYSKLHRYADAVWQQEASARTDHAHMMRERVLPDQIHNYSHNNEWLVRNLACLGRVSDAISLAENMLELPRHPEYNVPEKRRSSSAYGALRLAEVLEQFECWEELVEGVGKSLFDQPSPDVDQRRLRHRLLGRAHFELGQNEAGEQHLAALQALLKEQKTTRIDAADLAETAAREEQKSDADIAKAMTDVLQESAQQLRKTEQAIRELLIQQALVRGELDFAREELEKMDGDASLRADQRVRWLSLVGQHVEAEKLAAEQMTANPEEVVPLANLVEVLYRADKKAEAREKFEMLRPLAADAELERRIFKRLAPFASEWGCPDDWRMPRAASTDTGVRPAQESLGPFRWAPSPAHDWTLPDTTGKMLSQQEFRGRPVLVIFYLGSGCLHCVEQIQKFIPQAENFAQAGIEIVAISTEPLEVLQGSLAKLAPTEVMPLRFAADPELEVFKSYRAYDDFDKTPLHGVFLIDADGLVRWQDISYEPFTDAEFLLQESKRLLKIRS